MEGIDVHGDKGLIDWPRVKRAGVTFAFVKATEGASFVDRRIYQNLAAATSAGILVGPYHYARPDNRPSVDGARQEAEFFVKTIIASGWKPEKHGRPVLDIEVGYGNLDAWAMAFCEKVEELTKVRPILYTYTYFIRSHFASTRLTKFPLWLADYRYAAGKAPVSAPWSSYLCHQYTSRGSVSGVSGPCDRDWTANVKELRCVVPKPKEVWNVPRPKAAPKRIPKWVWEYIQWRKIRRKVSGDDL